MSDPESEYFKQLTGSAGANLIFVVAFMIYRALQNRCQKSKSKCATHCGFCDIEIENDDSSSSEDIEQGKHKNENIGERMPKVHQTNNRELQEGDPETLPFDVRKIREPENWRVANKTRTEEGIRETSLIEKAIPQRGRAKSQ